MQCYDEWGNSVDYYTQYDLNQTILIDIGENDLNVAPVVFFENQNSSKPDEVQSTLSGNTVSAAIPNHLLAEAYNLIVHVYASNPDNSASQRVIYSCEIPIRERVKPASYEDGTVTCTGISLNTTSASVTVGNTITLIATVSPYNTSSKVTWSTSGSSYATVSNGVVTGVKATSNAVTITAKCGSCSATCSVTVTS